MRHVINYVAYVVLTAIAVATIWSAFEDVYLEAGYLTSRGLGTIEMILVYIGILAGIYALAASIEWIH